MESMITKNNNCKLVFLTIMKRWIICLSYANTVSGRRWVIILSDKQDAPCSIRSKNLPTIAWVATWSKQDSPPSVTNPFEAAWIQIHRLEAIVEWMRYKIAFQEYFRHLSCANNKSPWTSPSPRTAKLSNHQNGQKDIPNVVNSSPSTYMNLDMSWNLDKIES